MIELTEPVRHFAGVGDTLEAKLAYAEERWSTWYALAASAEKRYERAEAAESERERSLDWFSELAGRHKARADRYEDALRRIATGSLVLYSPAIDRETTAMAQARYALSRLPTKETEPSDG